jgi:hypothetical protein
MKRFLRLFFAVAPFCLAFDLEAAASKSNFISSPFELQRRMKEQPRAPKPDFVVFVPAVTDTNVTDTGNEHFLAFDGPDGSLMAGWTQSSAESQPGPRNRSGMIVGRSITKVVDGQRFDAFRHRMDAAG